MNLLLDTHILLWSLLEPENLSDNVADELENTDNNLWLSPISIWEILILTEKGRIVLNSDPIAWVRHVLSSLPIKEAPLNHEVAIQSRLLQFPHNDPADRFIAATALVYDLSLVTADARLLSCDQYSVLPNK